MFFADTLMVDRASCRQRSVLDSVVTDVGQFDSTYRTSSKVSKKSETRTAAVSIGPLVTPPVPEIRPATHSLGTFRQWWFGWNFDPRSRGAGTRASPTWTAPAVVAGYITKLRYSNLR
jgi:hypothetical protein